MFNISFDFDPIGQKVSNVIVNSSELKRVKTRKKKSTNKPILEVEDNKIVLSDSLIELLEAQPGDRITINYHTINNRITIPLIGKSEYFADPASGNKLTKSNSVSFKGTQRTVLMEYGESFNVESFEDGIFKLIPIKENNTDEMTSEVKSQLLNEIEDMEDLDNKSELDIEIERLQEVDDLPF